MIPLIRIETERLILRNFLPNDEKDLFEYLLQRKHELFEPYEDISEDTIERHLKYRLKNDEFIAIELKENHKVIGNIYFGKRDFESREIGYILNQNYFHKGYATEAGKEIIKRAFDNGVHRIYAECDPRNNPSRRLLERLGLKKEGLLEKNVFFRRDEDNHPLWQDTMIYGLVNPKEK